MYVFGHVKITDVNYSRTSLPFQGLFVDTRIKVVAHPIFLKDASAFKSSSKHAIITYTNHFSALQKMTKQYCTLLSTISLLFNFSSEIHLYTLWSEVRHRGEGGCGGYSPLLFDKNAINLPMSHQSNFFLFVLSPPPLFSTLCGAREALVFWPFQYFVPTGTPEHILGRGGLYTDWQAFMVVFRRYLLMPRH